MFLLVTSIVSRVIRIFKKDENNEWDYLDEDKSLSERIGDAIVESIGDFGDMLCAPFDWLRERIP